MTRVCALPHYWLRHPNASSERRHAAHLACHTLNPSERPVLAVLCTTQTVMARVSRKFFGWVPVGTPVHPAGRLRTLWHTLRCVEQLVATGDYAHGNKIKSNAARRVGAFPITAASRFEEHCLTGGLTQSRSRNINPRHELAMRGCAQTASVCQPYAGPIHPAAKIGWPNGRDLVGTNERGFHEIGNKSVVSSFAARNSRVGRARARRCRHRLEHDHRCPGG